MTTRPGAAQCGSVVALLSEVLQLADWAQRLVVFASGASECLRVGAATAVSSPLSTLHTDAPPLVETLAACRLLRFVPSALAKPLVAHYLRAALVKQPVGSGFRAARAKESEIEKIKPSITPPPLSDVYRRYFGNICASEAWQVDPLTSERVCVSEAFVWCVTEHLPSSGHQRRTPIMPGVSILRAIDETPFVQPAAKKFNEDLMASFPLGLPSRLLVLGAGGTGKTILGMQLILETCRVSLLDLDGNTQFSPSCIPFRIPLAALVPILEDKREGWAVVKAYFADVRFFGPESVHAQAVQHVQAQADPGLLVLDGFDEVRGPNAGETQRRKRAVLNWIGTFDSSPVCAVVASRLAAVERLREAFGGLGFVARRVLPLTANMTANMVDQAAGRLGLAGAEKEALVTDIQRPEYL